MQMIKYNKEACERWSQTDAYYEHKEKTKKYTKKKWAEINNGLMTIFAEFAKCKNNRKSVDCAMIQALVDKLQTYITENYYTCTNEILAELGEMYVADERFKNNIDKYGKGTAEFASKAIAIFCQEK